MRDRDVFGVDERRNMYKIVVDHAPSQADNDVVREGITAFSAFLFL